jgi:hypothetical protein
MTGAPSGGVTTRWLVDGPELDGVGVGFGFEWVDRCDRTGRLVLGVTDVCVGLGETVRLGVGVLERARTAALDEHAAVAPRTHTTPATRAAKRSGPQRLTRSP